MPEQLSRLDRVLETSTDTLTRSVEKTEHLIEDREREDDYYLGKHFKQIKIAAFIYVFWLYIIDLTKDTKSIQSFVETTINSVLLVLATLFIERVFSKKEN